MNKEYFLTVMGDMSMRAQMAATGIGGGGFTKQSAKDFLKNRGYGDELNLPEIEMIRAGGVSDSQLAKWIKKQDVPLGSQAAAKFGIDYLSSGANLRPGYVKQFKDAGYSNKDIREAYEGTEGTIEERAAEMIAPKEKTFNLASYDPASKGGPKFGLRDIEFLKSKGLSDEAIKEYATGLESSPIGKRAKASLGLEVPTKVSEEKKIDLKETNKTVQEEPKQAPPLDKAQNLLNKTITDIRTTYEPETATVSTPTMLGGTQITAPSVVYGGSFAPTMRAPINQTIKGGGDLGEIQISSEMAPTYKNIGNISAGVKGMTGETTSQSGGVSTDIGGIESEVNNLIEKAKAKKK